MIKLTIVMKSAFLLTFMLSILTHQQIGADITYPVDGDAVRGQVEIRGFIGGLDLAAYDLEFSREAASGDLGWFLIATGNQALSQGAIGTWDTTAIVDGTYVIRLTLIYGNGERREIHRRGIRVRNYSAIETSIPGSIPTPVDILLPEKQSLIPTPEGDKTADSNPAEITWKELQIVWIAAGCLTVLLMIILFMRYNRSGRKRTRSRR